MDIELGRTYALRRKPTDHHEQPFRAKVALLPGRGGKVRVVHRGGELDGLDEWVPTRGVVCLWGERKAYLHDESRSDAIEAISRGQFDPIINDAIMYVTGASGEPGIGGTSQKSTAWVSGQDALRRIWVRAKLDDDPTLIRPGFVDRNQRVHLPWENARTWAQAFARAEPEPILTYIADTERDLKARSWEVGDTFNAEWLRRQLPAMAVARQWCGTAEVSEMQDRIDVLSRIVTSAISMLRGHGHEADATKLKRAFGIADDW
jgi:hypothetical protein